MRDTMAVATRIGAQTRINEFLACRTPETPCRVVDLATVERRLFALRTALPDARILHTVGTAPAPEVLRVTAGLGCWFDADDLTEVDLCLAEGIDIDRLAYTGPDIADAYDRGVRLFGVDTDQALENVAARAPRSAMFWRAACFPLVDTTVEALATARWLGLRPHAVAFQVTGDTDGWRDQVTVYARGVQEAFGQRFGGEQPRLFVEPSRSVLAEAEVVIGGPTSGKVPTYCV